MLFDGIMGIKGGGGNFIGGGGCHLFCMYLQKDPPLDLSNPNPFISEGDPQSKSVAYRYVAVSGCAYSQVLSN